MVAMVGVADFVSATLLPTVVEHEGTVGTTASSGAQGLRAASIARVVSNVARRSVALVATDESVVLLAAWRRGVRRLRLVCLSCEFLEILMTF